MNSVESASGPAVKCRSIIARSGGAACAAMSAHWARLAASWASKSIMVAPASFTILGHAGGARRFAAGVVDLVGGDDLGHQRVANDIRGGKVVEADALDSGQDMLGVAQAGLHAARQVDLGPVAGDR